MSVLSNADCVVEFFIISALSLLDAVRLSNSRSDVFCNIRAFDVVDLLMARRGNIGFSLDSNKEYDVR